jgi:quinol monooxygenase YgiN
MRFQVKDFDSWLNPDPGVPAKTMKDNGVLAYSLHRDPNDPNTIMIYTQFPDEKTLKSYVAFMESLPGEMKNFFAVPETVEQWIGTDMPAYSM